MSHHAQDDVTILNCWAKLFRVESSSMRTKPQIFISYAREDIGLVTHLYDKLTGAGFEPWLDKKSLVAGELWDHKIRKAIRHSDFFLACLSNRSINKRGFLQREIRQALDLWQEKLDDDIYLIPIRLEDCTIPENLSKFQCVDLFEEEGLTSLLSAIRVGTDRLKIPFKVEALSGNLTIVTKTIRDINEKAIKYTVEVDYPLIEGLDESTSEEINVSLQGFVLQTMHRFRRITLEPSDESSVEYTNELGIDYDVLLLTSQFLSIRFSIYEYYAGAAHGMTNIRTFNYHFQPSLLIELPDLFKTNANYLEILAAYCISDLRKQALMNGDDPDFLFLDGASPKEENFKAFNITPHSLIVTFEPYQVDCYAAGTKHVEIPYVAIQDHLNRDGIIYALLTPIEAQ